MIAFLWSTVAALGFMASGFLLRDGEFRLAMMAAVTAWVWLVFPKIPMWAIGGIVKRLKKGRPVASGRA